MGRKDTMGAMPQPSPLPVPKMPEPGGVAADVESQIGRPEPSEPNNPFARNVDSETLTALDQADLARQLALSPDIQSLKEELKQYGYDIKVAEGTDQPPLSIESLIESIDEVEAYRAKHPGALLGDDFIKGYLTDVDWPPLHDALMRLWTSPAAGMPDISEAPTLEHMESTVLPAVEEAQKSVPTSVIEAELAKPAIAEQVAEEKKEKVGFDAKRGDVFVGTNYGEEIKILDVVRNGEEPEGGHYVVVNTDINGKWKKYQLPPSKLSQLISQGFVREEEVSDEPITPADEKKPVRIIRAHRAGEKEMEPSSPIPDDHAALSDLLKTDKAQTPKLTRRERDTRRMRDETKKWESGDNDKPLSRTKNDTPEVSAGKGTDSKSPERSPSPDLGELLRVRKEEQAEKPTAGAEAAAVEVELADSSDKEHINLPDDPLRIEKLSAKLREYEERKQREKEKPGRRINMADVPRGGDRFERIEAPNETEYKRFILEAVLRRKQVSREELAAEATEKYGKLHNKFLFNEAFGIIEDYCTTGGTNLTGGTGLHSSTESAPNAAVAEEADPAVGSNPEITDPAETPVTAEAAAVETELAESIEKDPRYIAVETQLIKAWEKEHGAGWVGGHMTSQFQIFMYGDTLGRVEGKEPVALRDRVLKLFAEQYHDDFKRYQETKVPTSEETEGDTGENVFTPEVLANPNLDTPTPVADFTEPAAPAEATPHEGAAAEQTASIVTDTVSEKKPEVPSKSDAAALEKAEKEHFDSLPEAEKKTISGVLANLGYGVSALKAKIFRGIFEKLGGKDKTRAELATGSTSQRFITSYAELYKREEEQAKLAIEQQGKSGVAKALGMGSGSAVLMRYGRILYDFAAHGSLSYANPFRYATATAMFVSKNAEAAKEARLKSAEALDATRVAEVDQAYDEAQKVYAKAIESKDHEYTPTPQDLTQAYKRFMPKDLIDRLNRKKGDSWLSLKLAQRIADEDIKFSIKRLTKNLDAIETSKVNSEEKQRLSSKVLRRQEKFLNDIDRMVSNAGTVDQFAYWGYQMEKAGKHAATILMLDTARLMAQGVWDHLGRLGQLEHNEDTVTDVIHREAVASAAQETTQHAQVPGSGHIEMPVVSDDAKQTAADILHQSEVPHTPPVPSPSSYAPPEGAPDAQSTVAHAAERAASEPAVGVATQATAESAGGVAAATHAAEQAAAQTPIVEHAGMLGVEIHKGEGMIEAVGRTLENQYGLPHERAMQLANRVWAEHDPQQWYNLVHSGDKFSVDVHGVTPDALKTGDIGVLAKQIEYNPSHFEAASGLEPGHGIPHHEITHEAVAAAQAPEVAAVTSLGKDFTADQATAYYDSLPNHPVVIDSSSAQFLAEHQIHYDEATHQLWRDINEDGVKDISDKIIALQIPNAENIATIKLAGGSFPGQLIVEAWDKGNQHLGSFVVNADLEPVTQRVPDVLTEAALATVKHDFTLTHRFIDKLAEFKQHAGSADWLHKTAPSISQEEFAKIPAQIASGSKRELMKYLETQCEAPKGEAKAMTKTLHYIFEGLKKGLKRAGGKDFESNETVGGILKTLDFTKLPAP